MCCDRSIQRCTGISGGNLHFSIYGFWIFCSEFLGREYSKLYPRLDIKIARSFWLRLVHGTLCQELIFNLTYLSDCQGGSWKSSGGGLGVGQSWQDMVASRFSGVTYTNSTGKPIYVKVYALGNGGYNFYIDGRAIDAGYCHSGCYLSTGGIVNHGSTYTVTNSQIIYWNEYRQ